MSGFSVRFAVPADAPGIRTLFHRAFGTEMTAEEWQWKYAGSPDGWLGVVAESGGEIVGNYSGSGTRFVLGGEERLAYAIGDVATDPKVRLLGRQGVFGKMAGAFYAEVARRGLPFCFGFPSDRALAVSHRFAGTVSLRPIVLRRVPCEAIGPEPPGFAFGDSVGESFDSLWRAASAGLTAAAVRDRTRANWRFHARPARDYRMLWREEAGAMTAWAVLSVTGENAIVADYLGSAKDGADLPALFAAAAAEAARLGARRLVFWEPPGGPGALAIARLPGESAPAGFTLIARVFDEAAVRLFGASSFTPALYDVV
ncbi:MAG TPA: GNAT family N-acetyltransferase [Thermoanaerobaculia bacterium]|nr:GNAT family N-acetyltransferase [Thermoanaerobaculia bacterium]